MVIVDVDADDCGRRRRLSSSECPRTEDGEDGMFSASSICTEEVADEMLRRRRVNRINLSRGVTRLRRPSILFITIVVLLYHFFHFH
mmetsp:Transcript_9746/g.23846  ORF Transcript_9746/g.23846 Transcript_9746/m.23846 type:complete len:87 (+) Transcript_9746:3902-4162(+)